MSIYCDDYEEFIEMLRFAANEIRQNPEKKCT